MSMLSVNYEPEDDRHGKLAARVESRGFVGEGEAWFDTDALMRFADELAAYPLPPSAPIKIEGGYWDGSADELRQSHLSIAFEPHDLRGNIRVAVRLATPFEDAEDSELSQSVFVRFVVKYAELDGFRTEFSQMIAGQAATAELTTTGS